MMKGVQLVTVLVFALACSLSSAYDPSPLQDFCVAINDSTSSYAGLNTLGISLARIDFAPYGLNPPHIHPRATEILVVLEGTLAYQCCCLCRSQQPESWAHHHSNAVFGSNPPINPDVSRQGLPLDRNVVNYLQKKF
ncbi:hypothetical protein SLA2020_283570 [Shorea laevis]